MVEILSLLHYGLYIGDNRNSISKYFLCKYWNTWNINIFVIKKDMDLKTESCWWPCLFSDFPEFFLKPSISTNMCYVKEQPSLITIKIGNLNILLTSHQKILSSENFILLFCKDIELDYIPTKFYCSSICSSEDRV